MNAADYAATWDVALWMDDQAHAHASSLSISRIGICQEQTRRILLSEARTDSPDTTAARLGTWLHEGILTAVAAQSTSTQVEVEVEVTLAGQVLVGHVDLLDPAEPSVTDLKTVDGLGYAKAHGANRQQRYQRHLYYAAGVAAGLLPAEGIVRNVWIDRSGRDHGCHVEQEPYDPAVVEEAEAWLAGAIDAAADGVEAAKNLTMCGFCPFRTACRGNEDVSVVTPLPGVEIDEVARRYLTATRAEADAKAVKATARELLIGNNGRTDSGLTVKTSQVKGFEVAARYQPPQERVSVK
jgi:hypothetical protein